MTRWEYTATDSIHELDTLGEKGWEVFATVPEQVWYEGEKMTRTVHYLKRPKP